MTETPSSRRAAARARQAARRARRQRQALVSVTVLAALAVAAAAVSALALTPQARPSGVVPARGAVPAPPRSAAASASAAIAQSARPATLTVSAVGDMIFDRRVKSLIQTSGGAAPLAKVDQLLRRPDITVGNLESPLSSRGARDADKDVTFRGDPRAIEGLSNAGFDFLSLANNHVLDYGPDALADTISTLDDHGIGHAGAGTDKDAAFTPAVAERDGATIAFLSFSHILPPGFVATSSRPGLAQGRSNMDEVTEAIREAKAHNDYVIVSFHWGVEYVDDANADQVRDAHRAVDAGADMVLSHHPHVIQAVEYYKGQLIAYSLGDFVFDHYSRKTGEAFILDAELGPDGVANVSVTPVYLDTNGRPEVVTGSAAQTILSRLRQISAQRSTEVRVTGDTAEVLP
ncbi:MAG: CapA family protein [Coriobacteriales bacterium]